MKTRQLLKYIVTSIALLVMLTAEAAAQAPSEKDLIKKIFQSAIANIQAAKKRQVGAELKANAASGADRVTAEDEARQASLDVQDSLTSDMIPYVRFVAGGTAYRSLLSDLEEERIDKQGDAASTTSGGTSPVSKGSVPSLLGFAVEHGGLTQSTNETLITFRGNVANFAKALATKDYLKSGIDPDSAALIQGLQRVSFSISFDTKQGDQPGTFTGSKKQLAGASVHVDIYNKRDPRHPDYYKFWNTLISTSGTAAATALNQLSQAVRNYENPDTGTRPHTDWSAKARAAIASAAADQMEDVVVEHALAFREVFGDVPVLQPLFRNASSALDAYAQQRREGLTKIAKSPIVSFEYNFTRQIPQAEELDAMASGAASVTPMGGFPLPNLSSITVVGALPFGKTLNAPELTMNAATTFFNSRPAGSTVGTVRDYRLSAQLDVPLREIENVGRPKFSISYLFLALLEKPLGETVMINGQEIGTTGNIHLFQSKLTIPIKGSGMKIPISFTYSNRTELVLEKEKRGTIGITFDFDSLFARPKKED